MSGVLKKVNEGSSNVGVVRVTASGPYEGLPQHSAARLEERQRNHIVVKDDGHDAIAPSQCEKGGAVAEEESDDER